MFLAHSSLAPAQFSCVQQSHTAQEWEENQSQEVEDEPNMQISLTTRDRERFPDKWTRSLHKVFTHQ